MIKKIRNRVTVMVRKRFQIEIATSSPPPINSYGDLDDTDHSRLDQSSSTTNDEEVGTIIEEDCDNDEKEVCQSH